MDLYVNPAKFDLAEYSFAKKLLTIELSKEGLELPKNLKTSLEKACLLMDLGFIDQNHQNYMRRGKFNNAPKEKLKLYEDFLPYLIGTSLYNSGLEHHHISLALLPLLCFNQKPLLQNKSEKELLKRLVYNSHPIYLYNIRIKNSDKIMEKIENDAFLKMRKNSVVFFNDIKNLAKLYGEDISISFDKDKYTQEERCEDYSTKIKNIISFYSSDQNFDETNNAYYLYAKTLIGKADRMLSSLDSKTLSYLIRNKELIHHFQLGKKNG